MQPRESSHSCRPHSTLLIKFCKLLGEFLNPNDWHFQTCWLNSYCTLPLRVMMQASLSGTDICTQQPREVCVFVLHNLQRCRMLASSPKLHCLFYSIQYVLYIHRHSELCGVGAFIEFRSGVQFSSILRKGGHTTPHKTGYNLCFAWNKKALAYVWFRGKTKVKQTNNLKEEIFTTFQTTGLVH
jgi:hypothetical protein